MLRSIITQTGTSLRRKNPVISEMRAWFTSNKLVQAYVQPATSINYALIISGGKSGSLVRDYVLPPYSEHSDFLDSKLICQTLATQQICAKENIRVLFGSGAKNTKTITDHRLIYRFFDWLMGKENCYVDANEDLHVTGAASEEAVKEELSSLAKKALPNDRLFIFIGGHGKKGIGTMLWNKYFTTQFLTPKQLELSLEQFHPDIQIVMHVNSCHGGNFLMGTRKNISVYSSSTFSRSSRYYAGKSSEMVSKFLDYFSNQQTALYLHAHGTHADHSYFPSDSLTFFLDSKLSQYHSYKYFSRLADMYQLMMVNVNSTSRKGFVGSAMINFSLAFTIAYYFPPDHLLNKLFQAKIAAASLKTILPVVIKVGYVLMLQKYFKHLEDKFFASDLYKNYPVFKDSIYINNLKNKVSNASDLKITPEMQKFLNEIQDNLIWILSKIYQLRTSDINKPVVSRYNLLFMKTILFLELYCRENNIEAIREFVEISNKILDPLNLHSKKSDYLESRQNRFVTGILIKKSIFANQKAQNNMTVFESTLTPAKRNFHG